MRILIVIAISLLVVNLAYFHYKDQRELALLQSGQTTLLCNLTGRYEPVNPNTIVDKADHIYIFSNGYSKTCKILKEPNHATYPEQAHQ